MAQLKQQLQFTISQVSQNHRLVAGLHLIAVLALIYLFLGLTDYFTKRSQDLVRSSGRLGELQSLGEFSEWTRRLEQVRLIKSELSTGIWTAETEGLLQANIRAELSNLARNTGLETRDIEVTGLLDAYPEFGLSKIRIRLKATYSGDQVLDFLADVESSSKLMDINQLVLKKGKRFNSVDMILSAYVRQVKTVN